ncbi:TPA: hypothetical protein U1B25_001103 [Streptococcus suis]|nr:hypothetical protein [Streptococcus suis]
MKEEMTYKTENAFVKFFKAIFSFLEDVFYFVLRIFFLAVKTVIGVPLLIIYFIKTLIGGLIISFIGAGIISVFVPEYFPNFVVYLPTTEQMIIYGGLFIACLCTLLEALNMFFGDGESSL